MAIGVSATGIPQAALLTRSGPKPITLDGSFTYLCPPVYRTRPGYRFKRREKRTTICFIFEKKASGVDSRSVRVTNVSTENGDRQISTTRLTEKFGRKKSERFTYLVAAVLCVISLAVYYRFYWQIEVEEVQVVEVLGTIALSVAAAVGMEFWARWAHKALWHASLWNMHQSHHKPREGVFEMNDVFSIINAGPAIALLYYGFFNKGLFPRLCFSAGLEITLLGMAYIFVHDGLVHKRFPVGPIADVPYFQKLASAHQLHHSDKFNGVPYGFFLGPKELEEVEGGLEELEKVTNSRISLSKVPR